MSPLSRYWSTFTCMLWFSMVSGKASTPGHISISNGKIHLHQSILCFPRGVSVKFNLDTPIHTADPYSSKVKVLTGTKESYYSSLALFVCPFLTWSRNCSTKEAVSVMRQELVVKKKRKKNFLNELWEIIVPLATALMCVLANWHLAKEGKD